jgi:hypothetical protein
VLLSREALPRQEVEKVYFNEASIVVQASHHQTMHKIVNASIQEETISSSRREASEKKRKSEDIIDENNDQQVRDENERAAAVVPNKRKSIEGRFTELDAFKIKNGYCNPRSAPSNDSRSLGPWCYHLRAYCNQAQEGKAFRSSLSEDRVFEWVNNHNIFEIKFAELAAFKARYGHCNPSIALQQSIEYTSLIKWCSNLRSYYKQIEVGKKPREESLSYDQMKRLEGLGFEWVKDTNFDVKFAELTAFKVKFGRCNPSSAPTSEYTLLGQWCGQVRHYYKQIREGNEFRRSLFPDQIAKLDGLGFDWEINVNKFEGRLAELAAFKAKYGHCNPCRRSSEHRVLGSWYNNIRNYYKRIQEGKIHCGTLFLGHVERLEELDCEWNLNNSDTFKHKFEELVAYKKMHGHCNPSSSTASSSNTHPSVDEWCSNLRSYYQQIQEGKMPRGSLTLDQIVKLKVLGFQWV